MKQVFYISVLIILSCFTIGCYNDTDIQSRLDEHEARLLTLEKLSADMNTNISSLQKIVSALQNDDYITNVAPIVENGKEIGYTITFYKNGPVAVFHGKDGNTPAMGIMQDTDSLWKWTLNGNWMYDDSGNKIIAVGTNGDKGDDGITPQLKIEYDYWYISYDNGINWTRLGKATDEDGVSFIKDVEILENDVIINMVDGTKFNFTLIVGDTPTITRIRFLASDNPEYLVQDIEGIIVGDSVIECWCRQMTASKRLIPRIDWKGQFLKVDGNSYSNYMWYDFTEPVTLIVGNQKTSKKYLLNFHSFTGLPILWIDTKDNKAIESKDDYIRGSFLLKEDVVCRGAGNVFEDSVNIKGRGNFTWKHPKKPYRLKFDNKVSLLGEPKDKSWVLLANYTDRTFLRNYIAFYMGQMSNLEYTPRSHFVELILNGRYNGTYLLTEKLKISKQRVDVGDNGFLMEVDGYAKTESDARWFETLHLKQVVNIKDPEVEYDDDNYNYAKRYLLEAEAALYSDNFKDPEKGWQKYMDIDSFVDWYLINEICKNNDAFHWSAFFNLRRGGKLKLGPLWDFDNSMRWNYIQPAKDFFVKEQYWFTRLFEDPVFVNKVKSRFDYFYNKRKDIMSKINEMSNYLRYSYEEDYRRWGVDLYNRPGYGNVENEVQLVKDFLLERFEWLKTAFETLQ